MNSFARRNSYEIQFSKLSFATTLMLLLTFQAYAQHTVRYKLIELALGGPVIV